MATGSADPCWIHRLEQIDSKVEKIDFPALGDDYQPTQDHEWCEVTLDGKRRRIRFHDYDKIYMIPGLYEKLFYGRLKCCSPSQIVGLLHEVLSDRDQDPAELRVLDVGAGNGMVGDELQRIGAKRILGIDIIPEARTATDRDRPGVYQDYMVIDLTDPPEQQEEILRKHRLNCMVTVAALGFGDIPPKAFLKGMDLISTPGWMAFNIKEDFLDEADATGFSALVQQLSREEIIQVQSYRRYCHRLSMAGEPLHYVAVVAKKLRDVPDHLMEGTGE